MFPHYRRAVVVARNLDNAAEDPETGAILVEAASRVGPFPSETESARIAAWNEAYRAFGADPDKFSPSIRFLYTQIRRSKPPRPIGKIVDLMNAISIGWIAPCGGDDLDSLEGGDIVLGLARGDESFAPLFKPAAIENPLPGEVIYFTPQSRPDLFQLIARMANRGHLQNSFAHPQLLPDRQAVHIDSIGRKVFADNPRPQIHGLKRFAIHQQNLPAPPWPRVRATFQPEVANNLHLLELFHRKPLLCRAKNM